MVGFVIVSHSQALAESVVDLSKMMAPDARIAPAGGLEDGSFGTSFDKIGKAVETVYSDDGVLVVMDMGSAVMTAEMVLESMDGKKVEMVDCPIVEGTIAGTVDATLGMSMEEIKEDMEKAGTIKKLG